MVQKMNENNRLPNKYEAPDITDFIEYRDKENKDLWGPPWGNWSPQK